MMVRCVYSSCRRPQKATLDLVRVALRSCIKQVSDEAFASLTGGLCLLSLYLPFAPVDRKSPVRPGEEAGSGWRIVSGMVFKRL